MDVLDIAKQHFSDIERKEIEVLEWLDDKDRPVIIYSSPFTLNDRKKLMKMAGEDTHEFIVRALILKAENKAGEKMFDLSDKVSLMNGVDPDVVTRIVTEMGSNETPN